MRSHNNQSVWISYSTCSILCECIKSTNFCRPLARPAVLVDKYRASCVRLVIGSHGGRMSNGLYYVWKYYCQYMSSTQSYMTVCLLCMIYFICATTGCCSREFILTDPQTIFLSHCWKSLHQPLDTGWWLPLCIVHCPPPSPPPFSPTCHPTPHSWFTLKGGSWVSTGDEASRFCRFAFRRHFFQHLGFRLARSLPSPSTPAPLPVKLCMTDVFVLGVGVTGKSCGWLWLQCHQYCHDDVMHIHGNTNMLMTSLQWHHYDDILQWCISLMTWRDGVHAWCHQNDAIVLMSMVTIPLWWHHHDVVHEQALIAPPSCLDIDNPVTVGGVDPDLSYQATTNPQYQYDAESALETILEEQHGKVCADVSIFPVCM